MNPDKGDAPSMSMIRLVIELNTTVPLLCWKSAGLGEVPAEFIVKFPPKNVLSVLALKVPDEKLKVNSNIDFTSASLEDAVVLESKRARSSHCKIASTYHKCARTKREGTRAGKLTGGTLVGTSNHGKI